ncbi:MAG: secretin N-terminal domain-containing protein [Chthoniobacter sp.]
MLIPTGEQVITYIAKLHYADPTELQQTLTGFIGQSPGATPTSRALPKAQALLITENSATVRGLVHILHEIDVPPAEVVSEFIALERADASDVLEKLKAIFEKQPASGSAPGAAPVARPVTPAGTALPANTVVESTGERSLEIRAASLNEDSIIVGKIKLTADVRTNRIHVVTRPINMAFVRKLIGEFDSTARFGEPVSPPFALRAGGGCPGCGRQGDHRPRDEGRELFLVERQAGAGATIRTTIIRAMALVARTMPRPTAAAAVPAGLISTSAKDFPPNRWTPPRRLASSAPPRSSRTRTPTPSSSSAAKT